MAFLGEKVCADLHVQAVEIVGLCLGDASTLSALQGSGCLEQLLSHITESTDPVMKKTATETLASAAGDCMFPVTFQKQRLYFVFSIVLSRKILHEHEAEKTFIQLLSNEVKITNHISSSPY